MAGDGGERDCNSQSENEDDTNNTTLPDIPSLIDPTLPSRNSNSGNKHPVANIATAAAASTVSNAASTTSDQCVVTKTVGVVDLVSPPAIERHDFITSTGKNKTTRNLGELLCTLNFDVQPDETAGGN